MPSSLSVLSVRRWLLLLSAAVSLPPLVVWSTSGLVNAFATYAATFVAAVLFMTIWLMRAAKTAESPEAQFSTEAAQARTDRPAAQSGQIHDSSPSATSGLPSHDHPALAYQDARRRRLADAIILLFQRTCDAGDVDVAEKLLDALEISLLRESTVHDRRKLDIEFVISGRKRLCELRQPSAAVSDPVVKEPEEVPPAVR
jgi:hypothetical protein